MITNIFCSKKMSNLAWSQVGKDEFLIFYKFRLISVIKLLIVKTLLTFFCSEKMSIFDFLFLKLNFFIFYNFFNFFNFSNFQNEKLKMDIFGNFRK
jgi:hypothetical protein